MNTQISQSTKPSLSLMESRVKSLLEKHPTCKLDDYELFVKYFTTYFDKEFNLENFMRHKLNFESVARIRRKIVNMFPELSDSVASGCRVRKSISRSIRKAYC